MTALEPFLVPVLLAGVVAIVIGWVLRRRRIPNEHWLWKKRRLARARMLQGGGSLVSVASVAAFLLI